MRKAKNSLTEQFISEVEEKIKSKGDEDISPEKITELVNNTWNEFLASNNLDKKSYAVQKLKNDVQAIFDGIINQKSKSNKNGSQFSRR